jgi:hypothetical protein
MPLEEYQHRLLMREKLSVSDEYIFKQWDGDEEIFKHYLTGERYRGKTSPGECKPAF